MTSLAGRRTGSTAVLCAAVVAHLPLLERPLVRLGISVWDLPGAGRFYRSVAGRYADRLRRSRSQFRRVMVGDTPLSWTSPSSPPRRFSSETCPTSRKRPHYLRQRLRPGAVFADIGANHGYFTMLAAASSATRAACSPSSRIRASTNSSRTRAIERTSSIAWSSWRRRCGTRRVSSVCSSPNGAGTADVSTLMPGASLYCRGRASRRTQTISFSTETFDRWLASSGVERVDLVKIDTESSETHVVRGMSSALQSPARRSRRLRNPVGQRGTPAPVRLRVCAAAARDERTADEHRL